MLEENSTKPMNPIQTEFALMTEIYILLKINDLLIWFLSTSNNKNQNKQINILILNLDAQLNLFETVA